MIYFLKPQSWVNHYYFIPPPEQLTIIQINPRRQNGPAYLANVLTIISSSLIFYSAKELYLR